LREGQRHSHLPPSALTPIHLLNFAASPHGSLNLDYSNKSYHTSFPSSHPSNFRYSLVPYSPYVLATHAVHSSSHPQTSSLKCHSTSLTGSRSPTVTASNNTSPWRICRASYAVSLFVHNNAPSNHQKALHCLLTHLFTTFLDSRTSPTRAARIRKVQHATHGSCRSGKSNFCRGSIASRKHVRTSNFFLAIWLRKGAHDRVMEVTCSLSWSRISERRTVQMETRPVLTCDPSIRHGSNQRRTNMFTVRSYEAERRSG